MDAVGLGKPVAEVVICFGVNMKTYFLDNCLSLHQPPQPTLFMYNEHGLYMYDRPGTVGPSVAVLNAIYTYLVVIRDNTYQDTYIFHSTVLSTSDDPFGLT